ncbi:Abi family protein [Luteococcus sp. H138]|uniref:Abi family protein n=1 Tax=unclassified Luteococcus TaxID=2639923 RepID=UPI00313DF6C5
MSKPLKPPMSITQQIDLLRARGMYVDEEVARQWLPNVSYYRLSAYWYPARQMDSRGVRGDDFAPGTTFTQAVQLYEADRKLRTLVHDGMERVEVCMRTRIGNHLAEAGTLAYTNPALFRPSFNHEQWLRTAERRIDRASRHNDAIDHHRNLYGNRFPFWVLAEVLDFSDVSRLYEGLPAQAQRDIAEGLGLVINLDALSSGQRTKAKKQSPLVRWLEQLTIIRNTCAHHGRLWNKAFAPAPTTALRSQPNFSLLPEGQSERIFGALVVMARLLDATSPGGSWPRRVAELLSAEFLPNPLVNPSSMGLPAQWNHVL